MPTLNLEDNWLVSALEHLTAQWLKSALATSLPLLVAGEITDAEFAAQLTSLLEGRGLVTPSQQKNYRSNATQALKTIDPQHPAIPLVALSTETYRQLNDIQRGRLGHVQTKFISSATAESLVERATQLLSSAQWSDIGAGLAVLIGRRVSEILLSRFEPHSAWSILFRDPSKKSPELAADFAIEIPTLAPADVVLAAISKLQRSMKIDDLKAEAHTMKGAKQKINQRYSAAISSACNRHFAGMVESREGRDDLYSHLFRAVYATIAAHWFCPPNVPEHNFKAEIQGHFTIAADGAKLPNYSARANYDDYAIGDGLGNRDGRLGIKLELLDVQIIDAFRQGAGKDVAHLIADSADLDDPTDWGAEPLDWTEPADDRAEYELLTLDRVIRILNSLPRQQQPMSQPKPSSLRIDGNHRDRWLDLLDDICPHCTNQLERMEALLVWAEGQLDLVDQQAVQAEQQTQTQQQVVPELAKTMTWFTSRIEALEAEAVSLKAERDQLAKQAQSPDDSQQVMQLQAENQQLKTQLNQTQTTLNNIRSSLGIANGKADSTTNTAADTAARPTAAKATVPNLADTPEPAVSPAPTSAASTAKPQRDSHASTAKVHQIVDALMSWNSAQEDSESMLRISIPIVKAIGVAMGASYQQSIQQVLKEREAELETMHSQHMLGVRHNASVQGRDSILQSVARDYLGLENWQELKA